MELIIPPLMYSSKWPGYAEHQSTVFLTWHRAFVALLEESVRSTAEKIAGQDPAGLRDSYVKAASNLAWPYWDSASPHITSTKTLPTLIINKTVFITATNGSVVEMRNPFYSYVWQANWTDQDFNIRAQVGTMICAWIVKI